MPRRSALPCCLLLLVSACPAGPGTSTGGDTSTGDPTSTSATSTMGGSTTGTLPTTTDGTTTGATTIGTTTTTGPATSDTGATTSTATTDSTTDSTTGVTSEASTGAAACEDIVGSMDCPALVAVSGDLTIEECMTCQGAPCGQEPDCDSEYPCVDGSIVLRGCCTDEQCAGLTPFCGMFIATNNVCVLSDDI